MKKFQFKEFCNLDESENADYLIRSMDIMLSLDSVQKIKRESISFLNLHPGDKVLEAGCGFANDAELLSKAVGNEGKVVAIDTSKKMLAEAKKRMPYPNIDFQFMSVENIQYPDAYFSAVHADRLLVSHPNYQGIFEEMLRVVKDGGHLSITDVDAQTIAIMPHLNINPFIMKQLLSSFVNSNMGRKLMNVFCDYHLKNIRITPSLSTINSFDKLNKIFDFKKILNSCIKTKTITTKEANEWFRQMEEYDSEGNFFYCITFFTLSGQKPG